MEIAGYLWTGVITNSKIVSQIGGENGFVGLIAILLILAIFQETSEG